MESRPTYRMCYVYGSLWPKDDPMNRSRIFQTEHGPDRPPRTPSPPPSPFKKTLPHELPYLRILPLRILERLHLSLSLRRVLEHICHLDRIHLTEQNQENPNLELSNETRRYGDSDYDLGSVHLTLLKEAEAHRWKYEKLTSLHLYL